MEAITADRAGLERLQEKLDKAKAHAEYLRKRYWALRLKVIEYLGGKCEYCEETDVSKLEIHHDPPLLHSEKRNGFPRGSRSGESRIREWKEILEGKHKSKLVCKKCHVDKEHGGNTNSLKKEK